MSRFAPRISPGDTRMGDGETFENLLTAMTVQGYAVIRRRANHGYELSATDHLQQSIRASGQTLLDAIKALAVRLPPEASTQEDGAAR